jgi:hypothetical protein
MTRGLELFQRNMTAGATWKEQDVPIFIAHGGTPNGAVEAKATVRDG